MRAPSERSSGGDDKRVNRWLENQIASTKNGDILPNLVKRYLRIADSLLLPRTT
jgi:hypothetical protein